MLVEIVDYRHRVEEFLDRFGLSVVGDVVCGTPNNVDGYRPINDLETIYYELVKAYNNPKLDKFDLSMYIGNLPPKAITEMRSKGLSINNDNVLYIETITYEVYDKLETIQYQGGPASIYMRKLLSYWPTKFTIQSVNIHGEHRVSKWTPKFEYVKDAMVFHGNIPLYNDCVFDKDSLTRVLVTTILNSSCTAFKYTVYIADHPGIVTDELPTNSSIGYLYLQSKTWKYKLNKYLKEFKC